MPPGAFSHILPQRWQRGRELLKWRNCPKKKKEKKERRNLGKTSSSRSDEKRKCAEEDFFLETYHQIGAILYWDSLIENVHPDRRINSAALKSDLSNKSNGYASLQCSCPVEASNMLLFQKDNRINANFPKKKPLAILSRCTPMDPFFKGRQNFGNATPHVHPVI